MVLRTLKITAEWDFFEVPKSTVVYVTVDKAFLNVALLLHFHKYLKQIIHNITYDLHCENIELLWSFYLLFIKKDLLLEIKLFA